MESQDNTCPVCHELISVFAIGQCDHSICFKCSTRMRVLCEQMYCAICRTDLPEVYFIQRHAKFTSIERKGFIPNRKYKIFFENFKVEDIYKHLIEYRCKVCKDRPPEKNFYSLKDHMRREHTLFCCDICLNHLKIFAHERKFYNRRDLAIHRRTGDEDDKSYKGHPLCRFCDERYMDNDELLRHLRKDHYFCYFCDEASNEYYNDYDDLRQHFQAFHYLCEMDQCVDVKFTNAFRTDIDLKAHIAKEHHQRFNKAQAKEARTLDINFQLAPRPRGRARGATGVTSDDYEETSRVSSQVYRGRGYRSHDSGREERAQIEKAREESLREALRKSEKEMREVERKRREAAEAEERRLAKEEVKHQKNSLDMNFPALSGGAPVPSLVPAKHPSAPKGNQATEKSHSMSKRLTQPGRVSSHEYPSLLNSASSSSKRVTQASGKVTPNSGRESPVQRPVPTNSGNTSNIQTVPQSVVDSLRQKESSGSKNKNRTVLSKGEDFPTLGGKQNKRDNVNLVGLGVWSSKTNDRKTNNRSPVEQNYPQSLSSLGMDLCDNSFTVLGKKGKVPNAAPMSKNSVSKSREIAETKSKTDPPVKTRDRGPEECNSKGAENSQPKKPKKKKQKEKSDQGLTTSDSGTSGKDNKSKKSKSVPASKVPEQNDRDSGIESSSGSVDSSTAVFKSELEKREEEPKQAEAVPVSTSSVPGGSSLDCIAIGLLGNSLTNVEQKTPVLDNFPTLNSTPAIAAPPPGFKTAAAPPGFIKVSNAQPPPGFVSPNLKTVPASVENFEFAKPTNFSERNKTLVQSVSDSLCNNQEKFTKFKALSGSYRKGSMDAGKYYNSCAELLGENGFSKIVPELIALLPDIDKQQDLLSVHRDGLRSKGSVLKISKDRSAWSSSSDFKSCPTCRQVLLAQDFNDHIQTHSVADYPTLNGSGKQRSYPGRGSWVK